MGTSGANRRERYARFAQLDGTHPFRCRVPDGFVDYPARRLRGSSVCYFNFALAREMGLIPGDHPDRLNRRLTRRILATFSLVIINEYDRQRGTRFPARDRLSRRYMATRYLQLQHANRRGTTSGDGRSVWNGCVTFRGVTWDVSSCGTGVTRLCPGTAESGRFFKTGSRVADYGCGTASIREGLSAALMSETFHHNGIATERVLAVIALADGYAINVRAHPNLLRPSHFFMHLRQSRIDALRGVVDLFIDRQVRNGVMRPASRSRRYERLAVEMARTFGRLAAVFEREYVFCWLDWDGDNILADGSIIDYGSVRQFGLFHREYRFDDGPRWSTTIQEQRRKARHIVQIFAQLRDYLDRGRKRPLRSFAKDEILAVFDREFARTRASRLLLNVGFRDHTVRRLLSRSPDLVDRFDRSHAYFERARSARGPRPVEDGISWNAVFSTRDLLRELPALFGERAGLLPPREFLDLALSTFASRTDRRMTPHRARMSRRFQRDYLALVERAAKLERRPAPLLLGDLAWRSAIINRYDRITGDGVVYAVGKLMRHRRRLSAEQMYEIIHGFVRAQSPVPQGRGDEAYPRTTDARRVLNGMFELVRECRHGL